MPASSDQRHVAALGWVATATLAYLAFLVVRPFLTPLGWAAVMVIVFYPVHARLRRRFGPSGAALLTTVLIAFVVIVPLTILGMVFVNEALDAIRRLQEAIARGDFEWLEAGVRRILRRASIPDRPDVSSILIDATHRSAVVVGAYSGSVVRNLVSFVVDLVVVLFASFFLLRDAPRLVSVLRNVMPLHEAARDRLLAETADLIAVSVRSSVVVAGLQGLLGGLIFAAVGIRAPVFWGVVMAFFCLLPLGAWLVWLPAAIILAVSGQVGRAIVVAVFGFGVVSAVDNVLRPMLLSGRTSMNGLLVFISLLGGVAAFGAIGLVLGPVVMATATTTVAVYADSRGQSGPS